MNLDNVFGIYEQSLRLRNQRTEILASNIANADTPGYKAKDIDFRSVLKQQTVQPSRLQATNPKHFQNAEIGKSTAYVQFSNSGQPTLDGNTVDVQQEQLKFASNSARFEATMRFLNGKITSIEKALTSK